MAWLVVLPAERHKAWSMTGPTGLVSYGSAILPLPLLAGSRLIEGRRR